MPVPGRAPDKSLELTIPVSAAALYRLNGDLNPLHIDPAVAVAGGFSRPILHGLCTFGYAGYAVGRLTPIMDPMTIGAIAARFTAPFFPGETLRTEVWEGADEVQFRCRSVERDVVVLDRGLATAR
jgi:acyl dehydratase